MTIRSVGTGTAEGQGPIAEVEVATVACDDALTSMVGDIQQQLERSQSSTRDARRASLDSQQDRERLEVAKMREQATFTMIAGVVQGSMTIASATAKGIGAGVAAGAQGASAGEGTATAAAAHVPSDGVDAG